MFCGSLFRYTSCNYLIDNLDNGKTFFSKPAIFNDPFDCNFDRDLNNILICATRKAFEDNLQFQNIIKIFKNGQYKQLLPQIKQSGITNEMIEFLVCFANNKIDIENIDKITHAIGTSTININDIKSLIATAFQQINEYINNNVKIACFTTTNTNGLMWSHYADKHQGYCIEYDIKNFDYKFLFCLYPVLYSQTRFLIPLENYIEYSEKVSLKDFVNDTQFLKDIIKVLRTKSDIWSYEKEWRIILPKEEIPLLELPIKGVYLGSKIADKHKDEIYQIQQKRSFFIKQMVLDKNEYKLNVVDLVNSE